MKSILSAVIGATLALSAIEAGAQATAGERQVSLTIETDTLASALDKWAQQSGFQIFVQDWEGAKKLPARSLKGTFTAQDALEQLLSGTSLTYTWISDKAVSIRKKTAQTVPTALQRTSLDGEQGVAVAKFSGDDGEGASGIEGEARKSGEGARSADERLRTQALEEVLVTGSHIRGRGPVGSHLRTIERRQIESSGYATAKDLLQTVSQNFAPNDAELNGGSGNFTRGTGVNLRGLGPGATLTLVNGRRQPTGGEGSFVDVSSIPVSAIERIEIVSDGASAIYGSDAVGGVVNIVLRNSFSGAESRGRYASADGGSDEIVLSQLVGGGWETGTALAGYQYYHRSALRAIDRNYAASGDKTRFGGTDLRLGSPFSSPGNILDASFQPTYAIPRGQDGTSLTSGDFIAGTRNLFSPLAYSDLLPQNEMHSAYFSLSQHVGERAEVFMDGRYSRRSAETVLPPSSQNQLLFVPESNAFFVDPAGTLPLFGATIVAYNPVADFGVPKFDGTTETWTAAVGEKYAVGQSWQLTAALSYGRERTHSETVGELDPAALDAALADSDPTTAFNPFGDGSHTNPATLDGIRLPPHEFAYGSAVTSVSVVADGTLFEIASGAVKAAVGSEYRSESLDSAFRDESSFQSPGTLDRRVSSAYAEVTVPLWRSAHSDSDGLQASVAGRYERYSDFGSSFNPQVGVQFAPTRSISFSAKWGTSFRAPTLIELDEIPSSNVEILSDPLSVDGSGSTTFLTRIGNNASLKEETADIWSAGVEFTPESISGLSAAVYYHSIDYTDRVDNPQFTSGLFLGDIFLLDPMWNGTGVIDRSPTEAEIEQLCNTVPASFGGAAACATNHPTAILDLRPINLASVRTDGVDFNVDQEVATSLGQFRFGVDGTYTLSYRKQVTDSAPVLDVLDTVSNPLRLRLRGTVSWNRGPLTLDAAVNYVGSYEQVSAVQTRSVSAWTTIDLGFGIRFETGVWLMDDTEVALRAVNVFDESPPFVNTSFGFDSSNASPLGRLISLNVQKSW